MFYGSDEFNSAIENTHGNAPKTRLKFADDEILDLVSSIRYYGGSNDSDDVSIGTTTMARVEVSAYTDKLLANREFLLEQGIELANGVVEYMPIGYFTIQKPSGDIDQVTFTAYDRMQKFEKPYSSSLAYPTTSILILDELCQICGIELATTLDNAIEVTENLKGYTCREVLGYIASMHSSFACIDRYGRLNLRWYSNTPIEKSLKKIWHFEKSQDNFEIAKVDIAKNSETNYVSGDGITTLHNSNPLATQEITDGIFAKLGGFSYSVGEIEMLDDARLDPWDMVSVEYYDGKTYIIPCMSLEHDFKAYSTTVKSVGKSESENEYRFTGPTIQYLNRMAADLLVANRVIATKVDAEYVNSVAITTENFDAKVAEIKELIVEEIDGKYANIDLANVEVANIGEFFARSGILENVLIDNGAVTGTLKGVRIVGDVIEANTIKADSLILSGSEDSLIYQINVNASGLTAEQLSDEIYKQKLSGTDLVAQSVTANELAAGCITTSKIQAGAITSNEIAANTITGNNLASNTITSREINVDDLFAEDITATGTIRGAILKSINYDEDTGVGMLLDLNNATIESRGEDFVNIFDSKGHYGRYILAPEGMIFAEERDYLTGQPNLSITNGQLTLNNVKYNSYGINYGGSDIINWTTKGIATPKLSTDLIYCNGEIAAKTIKASVVQNSTYNLQSVGNMAVTNKQSIATINSNLTTNNISITGNNSYGNIVCKMKNNRVVLNGYIVTSSDISPNTYATIGTVEVGARPNVSTVIIVGVLGYDGVAQGMCIGEVTTNGEIIVKNTLNLYTRHFYFDAVWDV